MFRAAGAVVVRATVAPMAIETVHAPAPAKIPLINGLRGLAILGVVFHHLFGQTFVQGENVSWFGAIPFSRFTLLTNSYQGVGLFFLLSGFVLALPYAQGRRTMRSWTDAVEFFGRRARRLLPLYALAVLIGLIFIAPSDDLFIFTKKALLFLTASFTFTEKYFFPDENFVLWSLSLEILFCAFFPLLLRAMHAYRAWPVVAACCIVALIARLFGIFLIEDHHAALFTGTTTPIFNTIFCRIDDFALGMGLAFLYVRAPKLRAPWLWYGIGIALVLAGFTLRDATVGLLPLALQPFSNTLVNLGFFALLAVMLLRPNRVWKMTIENPGLQLIGLMSYSIFVWHGVAMAPLNANETPLTLARYVVLVGALSFLTYRYVESGSPKRLRDVLPRRARIDTLEEA